MENIEITKMLFNAMNSGDFSEIQSYFSPDIEFDFPGVKRVKGNRKVVIFLNALLRKYRKLVFTLDDFVIDKDKICAIWSNVGVKTDSIPYSNSGITLLHFENGKITFLSDYFKDTSFTN